MNYQFLNVYVITENFKNEEVLGAEIINTMTEGSTIAEVMQNFFLEYNSNLYFNPGDIETDFKVYNYTYFLDDNLNIKDHQLKELKPKNKICNYADFADFSELDFFLYKEEDKEETKHAITFYFIFNNKQPKQELYILDTYFNN